MLLNQPVCIDASIVLKLVVVEADSDRASALWRSLAATGHRPVAPPLLLFECVSTLRRLVARGVLGGNAGRIALGCLLSLPIAFPIPDGLVDRTWQLAARFQQPQAYDCFYLALADLLRVAFWTADRRLYKVVHDELAWVHLLDEHGVS